MNSDAKESVMLASLNELMADVLRLLTFQHDPAHRRPRRDSDPADKAKR